MQTVEELGQEIASLSAHLDAAAHRLLECIRRFDEACGWQEQGAVSCAHWLAWRLGWDPATAREKVRVARALGMLPAISESLRTARLSYAKVRALTRVATPENEAKLLEMALIATGAQLERLCRCYRGVLDGERTPAAEERSVRQRLLPGGMVKLELVLEPDEADLILRAIERTREVHARQAEPLETEAPGAPAVAAEAALSAAQGGAEAAEAAGGRVAAGVTPRGSHRSGRADFPHPAPRSTVSLRYGRRCERFVQAAAGSAATAVGIVPISSWLGLTVGSASSAILARPHGENDSGRARFR